MVRGPLLYPSSTPVLAQLDAGMLEKYLHRTCARRDGFANTPQKHKIPNNNQKLRWARFRERYRRIASENYRSDSNH